MAPSNFNRIQVENKTIQGDYWDTNKIGLGLLLEYRQEIVSDEISLFVSTVPEEYSIRELA